MTARDPAAVVRDKLVYALSRANLTYDDNWELLHEWDRLSALEQQLDEAQDAIRMHDAQAGTFLARAVRAEEALRQIADAASDGKIEVRRVTKKVAIHRLSVVRNIVREALASGGDT